MKVLQYAVQYLVLLIVISAIFVLQSPKLLSALHSNVAWLTLNSLMSNETKNASNMNDVLNSFSQAIKIDAGNKSAGFGLGIAFALQEEFAQAFNSWSRSVNDPITLIEYGLHAQRKGNVEVALTQFRAADALDKATELTEGEILAGTICQQVLGSHYQLSENNQQFCSDFVKNNNNNLFVNNSFSTGSSAGWAGTHFFTGKNAARLSIESHSSSGDSVISLQGLDESNHFGIFQRLNLSPGDQVHFSGRFKLSGEENLKARILYISWQKEDGVVQGNHGEVHIRDLPWAKFERTFTVPENSKPSIDFYPVLFSGGGTVWFDDIQLEMIHE